METDRLAQLIEQKHTILTQLRELSQRQSDLIQGGDIARLLSLLAAKQASLQDLQNVEKELDPYREQDPEQRQWRSPELRQRVRQVVADSQSLLQEIMQVEQVCESQLAQRRGDAAERLQGVHDVSSARKAYLQDAPSRVRQLDLTSEH